MKRLLSILWSHAPRLLIATVCLGALTGLCNTSLLNIINQIIKDPVAGTTYVGSFFGLVLAVPLLMLINHYCMVQLTQKVTYRMRMSMVRGVLKAPLRRLEEMGQNKLLTGLTADVAAISQALSLFPTLFMQITIIASCIAYLAVLYWPAAVGVVIAMAFGLGAYRLVQVRGMNRFVTARELQDNLFDNFRALIFGAKELKLHKARAQSFVDDHVHKTTLGLLKTLRSASVYFSLGGSMGRFFFFAAIGVCLFLLPQQDPNMNREVLTGYALVMLFLLGPLEQITAVIPMYGKAFIALGKVDALGASLERDQHEEDMDTTPFTHWRQLQLKGITHGYHLEKEDSTFMLGPVDLTIERGDLIFLVGGNGSGKTTLAKLILGLYLPEGGHIKLNNRVVDDQNRVSYRQLFSAIFVDFFLFDQFIGLETAGSDVQDYLELLLLHHKVTVKDGHLSTTQLSQGQRKRLALLTAYLEDRQIYLFDEWAADQDPAYKKIFYEKLLPELKAKGKTIIVISHDDAYFHVADRIIKLDFGRVVEDQTLTHPPHTPK